MEPLSLLGFVRIPTSVKWFFDLETSVVGRPVDPRGTSRAKGPDSVKYREKADSPIFQLAARAGGAGNGRTAVRLPFGWAYPMSPLPSAARALSPRVPSSASASPACPWWFGIPSPFLPVLNATDAICLKRARRFSVQPRRRCLFQNGLCRSEVLLVVVRCAHNESSFSGPSVGRSSVQCDKDSCSLGVSPMPRSLALRSRARSALASSTNRRA